jgi:superfamily II helicase
MNTKPKVENELDKLALTEAEKVKPSSDSSYWAKRSCNRCYGRGTIGKFTSKVETNTFVQDLLCECARNRYSKWLKNWVNEFKAKYQNQSVLGSVTSVDNAP